MERKNVASVQERTSQSLKALKAKFKKLLSDVHETSSSSSSNSSKSVKRSFSSTLKRTKSASSYISPFESPSEAKKIGMSSEISSDDEVKAKSRPPKKTLQALLQQDRVEATSLLLHDETGPPPLSISPSGSFASQKGSWGRLWETSSEPTSPADLSHNFNLNYRGGASSPISLLHSLSQKDSVRHTGQLSEIFLASSISSSIDYEQQGGILDDILTTSFSLTSSKIQTLSGVRYDEDQGERRCCYCDWVYTDPNPSLQDKREHKKYCMSIMSVHQWPGGDATLEGGRVQGETGAANEDLQGVVEEPMMTDGLFSERLHETDELPIAKFYEEHNNERNSNLSYDHHDVQRCSTEDNNYEIGQQSEKFVGDSKQEGEDNNPDSIEHLYCETQFAEALVVSMEMNNEQWGRNMPMEEMETAESVDGQGNHAKVLCTLVNQDNDNQGQKLGSYFLGEMAINDDHAVKRVSKAVEDADENIQSAYDAPKRTEIEEDINSIIKLGAVGEVLGKEGEEMESSCSGRASEKVKVVVPAEENDQVGKSSLNRAPFDKANVLESEVMNPCVSEVKVKDDRELEKSLSDSQMVQERILSDAQNKKAEHHIVSDKQNIEPHEVKVINDHNKKPEIDGAKSSFKISQDNLEEILASLHDEKVGIEHLELSLGPVMNGEDKEMKVGSKHVQIQKGDLEKMRASATDGLNAMVGTVEQEVIEQIITDASNLKEDVKHFHSDSHHATERKEKCKGSGEIFVEADPQDENDPLNEFVVVAREEADCKNSVSEEQSMKVVKGEASQTMAPHSESVQMGSDLVRSGGEMRCTFLDPKVHLETLDEFHDSDGVCVLVAPGEEKLKSPYPNLDVDLRTAEEKDFEQPDHGKQFAVTSKNGLHVKVPLASKGSSEVAGFMFETSLSETLNPPDRQNIFDDATVASQLESCETGTKFSSVQRYWADVSRSEYLLIEGKKSPSFKNADDQEFPSLKIAEGISPSSVLRGKHEYEDIERSSPVVSTMFQRRLECDVDDGEITGDEHAHQEASSSSANMECDFEQVVRQQTTHDLVCPVCGSCVTKRIILKKRKRTRTLDDATLATARDMKPRLIDRERSPDSTRLVNDNEDEVWGCLACLSFFIFTEKGFGVGNRASKSESQMNLQTSMFQERWERTPCVPLFPFFQREPTRLDPGPFNPPLKEIRREESVVQTEEATTSGRADVHQVPLYEEEEENQVSCLSYFKTVNTQTALAQANRNVLGGGSAMVESEEPLLPISSLDRREESITGQPVVEMGVERTKSNSLQTLISQCLQMQDRREENNTTGLTSSHGTARQDEEATLDDLTEKASQSCIPLLLPTFSWGPNTMGDQGVKAYIEEAGVPLSKQAAPPGSQQEESHKDLSEKAPSVLEKSFKDVEEDAIVETPTTPSPAQGRISGDGSQVEPVEQISIISIDKASLVCLPELSLTWCSLGRKRDLEVKVAEGVEKTAEPSSQLDVSKKVQENIQQNSKVTASIQSKFSPEVEAECESLNSSVSAQYVSENGVQLPAVLQQPVANDRAPLMSGLKELTVECFDDPTKGPLKALSVVEEMLGDNHQAELTPNIQILTPPVEKVSLVGLPLFPAFSWGASIRPSDSDVQVSSWKFEEAVDMSTSTSNTIAGNAEIGCSQAGQNDAKVEIIKTRLEGPVPLLVEAEEIILTTSSSESREQEASHLEEVGISDEQKCTQHMMNNIIGTNSSIAAPLFEEQPARKIGKEEDCTCLPLPVPKFSWGPSVVFTGLDLNAGVEGKVREESVRSALQEEKLEEFHAVSQHQEEFIDPFARLIPYKEQVPGIGYLDQIGSQLKPDNHVAAEPFLETKDNDISLSSPSQSDAAYVGVIESFVSGATTSQTSPGMPSMESQKRANCNCLSEILPTFSWGTPFPRCEVSLPADTVDHQDGTEIFHDDGMIRNIQVLDEKGEGIVKFRSTEEAFQVSSSLEKMRKGKEIYVSRTMEIPDALPGCVVMDERVCPPLSLSVGNEASSQTQLDYEDILPSRPPVLVVPGDMRTQSPEFVTLDESSKVVSEETSGQLSEQNTDVAASCSPSTSASPPSPVSRKIIMKESYIEGHVTTTQRIITMTKSDDEQNEEIGSIQVDHYVSHFEGDIENGHFIPAKPKESLEQVQQQPTVGNVVSYNDSDLKRDYLKASVSESILPNEKPTVSTEGQDHVRPGMSASAGAAEDMSVLDITPEEDICSEIKPLQPSPLGQPETLETMKGKPTQDIQVENKFQRVSCSCLPLPVTSGSWLWPSRDSLAEDDELRKHLLGDSEEYNSRNCFPALPSFSLLKVQEQVITVYSSTTGSLPGPGPDVVQERITTSEDCQEGDVQSAEGSFREVLKSVVYGGLDVTLVSLGIVSSAAGSNAKTVTVLAMGLANVVFGLITFFRTVTSLYYNNREVFKQQIGQSFQFNGALAHLSFLFFGVMVPITYAFSFRHSLNVNYKFASSCVTSFIAILMLGTAKAVVESKSAIRIIWALLVTGFLAAISGYGVGHLVTVLLDQWGFDSE